MKFVWFDKNEHEMDIIISVLSKEQVKFKIIDKSEAGISMFGCPTLRCRYDIEVNTSLEYWDYLNKLIYERAKLFKTYDLECITHPPVNETYIRERAEERVQGIIDKLFRKTRELENKHAIK